MAKRVRGRFSPESTHDENDLPPAYTPIHAYDGRPKWVTIAAIPFLIGAFFQPVEGLLTNLAGFGLIAAGMWMTREGLTAEATYHARRIARRPAIPRKLFGGLIAGLGLSVATYEPAAAAASVFMGLAGFALSMFAFGTDPMRDKGVEGMDSFQQDRANKLIEEGQRYLDQMKEAIRRTGSRSLEARVSMFEAIVHQLFDQVRQDPNDLAATRRYLGVYLMGARDATIKFSDLFARSQDAKSRVAFEQFLTDLEKDFMARMQQLLEGSRTDLDIEISVLRERLAREGVRQPEQDDTPALQSPSAQSLDELLSGSKQRQESR